MTFADIPAGVALFLDTNTLVYYFSPHRVLGPVCAALLQRIENQEIQGVTSAAVLAEMAHRLMAHEAALRFGWLQQGMANRLKRHPAEVQQLSRYRQAIDELKLIGVRILMTTGPLVSLAADISYQTGLLTNDALIVSTMRDAGLTHLASHDSDFDRVPGITRYAPA
jgi:predicted nucleic acid-binding protein